MLQTILVTGASQGMGKALAQLLASRGANVIIVARTTKNLQSALEDIRVRRLARQKTGCSPLLQASAVDAKMQRFHYISADLTSSSEATRILNESTSWNDGNPPDHVLCVAGASHPEYFLEVEPSLLKEQMDTNYFSAAYMAQASCKAWLSETEKLPISKKTAEPRHLVFVSSLVALIPMVGYTPYSPAKIAVRHLSDTLAQELLLYEDRTPIRTHCVFASTISSPGLDKENETKPAITKKLEETDGSQTPEEIALETLKGLEKGYANFSPSGLLGTLMVTGSLGGSRRRGLGIVDTLVSWVVAIILPIVRKDFDSKVRAWGKANIGVSSKEPQA